MSHDEAPYVAVAENRFSKVEYKKFINNVRESEDSKEPAQMLKPKQSTAEDEVVAILLAAMMGSIVKNWKTESSLPTVETKVSPKSSGEVESLRESFSGEKGRVSRVTFGSARRSTKPHPFAEEETSIPEVVDESTDDAFKTSVEHLDMTKSQTFGSMRTHTHSSTENSVQDEHSSIGLERFKELFTNDKDDIYGWEFLEQDKEFNITFKSGHRYEGKLLNCRMHGNGKFTWADGTYYDGEFFMGKMTGRGFLQWSDTSWYEGELRDGHRHGRGLHVCAPTFYAGYWKCGRRHGVGAMFYNHFDTDRNYYNGEWKGDKKHGTGLRSYPSGAMYSGQWRSGRRHGLGTMVWPNRDVYSGNFHRGRMHGYGEYTWDTFYNRQLVVAAENCYYGGWERNVRHGNGTLETSTGVVVKGSWSRGKKHGPAEVVCSNGAFLYDENLFDEDNICLSDNIEDSLDGSLHTLYKLPVSAACHEVNLGYYVDRLVEFSNESKSLGKPFGVAIDGPDKLNSKRTFSFNRCFEPEENKFDLKEEETHIRNVIMQFQSILKVIYTTYSQVCCSPKPTFPTVLMRLMWWQLLRDCDLHSRGVSLADIDTCIAKNKASLVQGVHYPFERLLFWQFLHCLIEVSWELYGKNCEGTPSVKGIIASGLHKLITSDLVPNAGRHKGNALFGCKDLLSLDALYWYYRGVGEPHSARDFLKLASSSPETSSAQGSGGISKPRSAMDLLKQASFTPEKTLGGGAPEYYEHQTRGRNVIGVGGKLTYFPQEEPLLQSDKYKDLPGNPKDLSSSSSIGLLAILDCIRQICPSVSSGDLLVNMDYKIVFLEFYEILLLCASKKAKLEISESKKKEEEEYKAMPTENTSAEEPSLQVEESLPPPEKKSQRKKSSVSKKHKKKK